MNGTSDDDVEPMQLAQLNGAVLAYDDGDGNREEVHFDDKTDTDTESRNTEEETDSPTISVPDQYW